MSVFKLKKLTAGDSAPQPWANNAIFPTGVPVDILDSIGLNKDDILGAHGGPVYEDIASLLRSEEWCLNDGDKDYNSKMSLYLLKWGTCPVWINRDDDRPEVRVGFCDHFWHQRFYNMSVQTTSGRYTCKDWEGILGCHYSVKLFSGAGAFLGNGYNSDDSNHVVTNYAEAEKTLIIFSPSFSYALIAGRLSIPADLPGNDIQKWRLWTTAIPDYATNGSGDHRSLTVAPNVPFNIFTHGGVSRPNSILPFPFIDGKNLRFFRDRQIVFDGRGSKKFPYAYHPSLGNLGLNTIHLLIEHPKGQQADFEVEIEAYEE